MKTERLYYGNPYLLEFDARVLETVPIEDRFGIILDRTAFYPTSGGQPNDLGTIEEIPLLDCYEDEKSEAIIHLLGAPPPTQRIHGKIDRARRSDHMQQHSGQHVLSQAFVELFNWPTVSFHLGASACTIDLAVETVSRQETASAELLANRIVQDNRNVTVRYVDEQNVREAGLRKATERAGEIRIIDIADYDKSACGGTHVRMTAEIGPILITRIERAKKQTRVQFICGNRVWLYASEAHRALEGISQIISVPALEAAGGVQTMWDTLQQSRKRIEELELKLLDYEAREFPLQDGFAIAAFKGRGIETVKALAARICERPSAVALLADESDQLRIVLARSEDRDINVATVLKQVLDRFGGRGGGRPNLAQGGGLGASNAAEVLQFARDLCCGHRG